MYNPHADIALEELARLIRDESCLPATDRQGDQLKVGVDLGTANIVLAVVDEANRPVAGAIYPSTVVRDGIVVDYVGAISVVKRLKAQLEERLGCALVTAGTAIPPGILPGNVKAISNVVEAADFDVVEVIDEPTAAARLLGVQEGAVVDVGGGTTGISVLEQGRVVLAADEATGGTHMTLVLAGARGIPLDQAEALKKNDDLSGEVFSIVRPVVEKMASIVTRYLNGRNAGAIYVVGGACSFDQFVPVFQKQTGWSVIKPVHPLLVTPLGIAMYDLPPQAGGEK